MEMKKQNGNALVGFLFMGAVILLAVGGWIANVVKIVHSEFVWSSGMFIARVIGVFVAPLGAVLGYC
jgi:hypothetical protein